MEKIKPTKNDLIEKQNELTERISKIKADLKRGLDPDMEEQAIQLENYEVLYELLQNAESELVDINRQLARISRESITD